jgi:aspartyl-tRNA(Asn)/glutamyl-tRNA(Gln) amidotransferase subunit A
VGLKPTYGLVSLRGVTPLSRSLDHAGPMATSVEDAFLLLEGISGFRREAMPRPRILLPRNYFFEDVEPEIVDLVRAAAARLGKTESVEVPGVEEAWNANTVILFSDAAALHEDQLKEHPEWFGEKLAERMSTGFKYRGVDYARARDVQRDWTAYLTAMLGDDAVLAAPTTPVPATVIGDREGTVLGRLMTRLTAPFNLAGAPALSVPAGNIGALPIGMQLVAAPGRESVLWAVAQGL